MGKTWVAAEIARAVLRGRTDLLRVQPRISERQNRKILFIAHQSEILNQAVRSFQRLGVINADQIGILYASFSPDILRLRLGSPEDQFNREVVFATPQTLDSHLDWLTSHPDHFTMVIFDEAHHTVAETWSNTAIATEDCEYRLGFTATPFRLDKNKILPSFASNLLSETTLSRGIYLGYLVEPTYVLCKPTSDAASERSRTIKIPELLAQPGVILAKLSEKLIKNGKLLRTVVFCDSIRNAERWSELIADHFQQKIGRPINRKVLHDETPKRERDETYKGFNSGLIDILFVKGLFDEGVDVPGIEGIVFLRQTKSLGKVLQQMGRGLRLAPGKRDVVVIDFISNYSNLTTLFQLMSLIDLGGSNKSRPKLPRTKETPPIDDDDLDETIISRLQIDRDVRVYIQNEYEKEKEIGLVEKVAALRARKTPLSEIRRELQVSRGGLSDKQFAELYRFRVPDYELKKSPNDLIKHSLDVIYQGMRDIAYGAEPGQKPKQTKEAGRLIIISTGLSSQMYNTMWDCFERGLSYADFCETVLEKHKQELIIGRRRLRRR
jgi:superfamily II DNA or RNA helicase